MLTSRLVLARWFLVASGPGEGLGGEVSNLDLGLQRTPCCRYTTPDRSSSTLLSHSLHLIDSLAAGRDTRPAAARSCAARSRDVTRRGRPSTLTRLMGSLIKKRRKRMRKKKHKKLLKKTRWQRRQQGR